MLVVTVLSLLLALIQVLGVFVTFPSALDPGFYPSPLRREVGCGLVLCGLDHTLFHFVQFILLLTLAFFAYRAYLTTGSG